MELLRLLAYLLTVMVLSVLLLTCAVHIMAWLAARMLPLFLG